MLALNQYYVVYLNIGFQMRKMMVAVKNFASLTSNLALSGECILKLILLSIHVHLKSYI